MRAVQFGRFPMECVPGREHVARNVSQLSFVRPSAGFGLAAHCGTTTRTVQLVLVLRYAAEVEYAIEDKGTVDEVEEVEEDENENNERINTADNPPKSFVDTLTFGLYKIMNSCAFHGTMCTK
jgi:hypothetical protein